MSDFYWWWCPPCQGTGKFPLGNYRERVCQCCGGTGKIKLPTGFVLMPNQQPPTFTTAGTNYVKD